jgi:AAA+ ATPase superfamily predicted ATPase
MKKIVGREKEITLFNRVLSSQKAEFIAIYGRRRVGKTYLINQYFFNKGIYFECTGIKEGGLKNQLKNFFTGFQKTFHHNLIFSVPSNWRQAFELLTYEIRKIPENKKIILFFDELPWLATRKSLFLQELDYFWNTQWSRMHNVKLIVSGSAASWILDNLINAKGGLHNRITEIIRLNPFTLSETKKYLKTIMNMKLNLMQVLDLYMIIGGIPFYLSQLNKNKSVTQNINDLCFSKEGVLHSEFPRLFKSLFEAYEINLRIIKAISKFRYGISFSQLLKTVGRKAGGRFKDRLNELEAAGFIDRVLPYGKKRRDHYYRISDEYTMFYLNWIENTTGKIPTNSQYWLTLSKSPAWNSWSGYAFEIVCHKHVHKIINALQIDNTGCLVSSWKHIPNPKENTQGAQIDLLLNRNDNAISICEIKHSSKQFSIDKSYATHLKNKMQLFQNKTGTSKQLFLVLITTKGLKRNTWSEDLVNEVIELENLF